MHESIQHKLAQSVIFFPFLRWNKNTHKTEKSRHPKNSDLLRHKYEANYNGLAIKYGNRANSCWMCRIWREQAWQNWNCNVHTVAAIDRPMTNVFRTFVFALKMCVCVFYLCMCCTCIQVIIFQSSRWFGLEGNRPNTSKMNITNTGTCSRCIIEMMAW